MQYTDFISNRLPDGSFYVIVADDYGRIRILAPRLFKEVLHRSNQKSNQ